MHLRPGFADEYKKRHDEIWPELQELIKSTGVYDYSICLDEDTNTLFASHKQSGDTGAQDLGSNPIVQKWWAHMADIMETKEDNSPKMTILREVFHLE